MRVAPRRVRLNYWLSTTGKIKPYSRTPRKTMAKNQNTMEKRRREMEKKLKAEEKRKQLREKKEQTDKRATNDTPT
jgi:hypothetical protein